MNALRPHIKGSTQNGYMYNRAACIRNGVGIPPPHQPSPALRQPFDKLRATSQGTARLLRLPLKGGVIGPSNWRAFPATLLFAAEHHEAAPGRQDVESFRITERTIASPKALALPVEIA